MNAELSDISVCALVPYPVGISPSQRFRLEQWAPHLRAAGIAVTFRPFLSECGLRVLQQPRRLAAKAASLTSAFVRAGLRLPDLRRYDAIIIHRAVAVAGPALLERLIALCGRPVIFDFDDAIFFLHSSAHNRRFGWLKFPGKTAAICRLSRHIVVGNNYLADYARQFNPQVTVIPTSIDTERYTPRATARSSDRVTIGWTGSSTSQTHLEMFLPVLREVVARLPVEVRVVSNREPELPGIPYVWRPWTAATEVDEVARFDIGIMPMPDDKWAKGKCALKALQYMALGIPPVCSAVGANCEVVRHGSNGLLASTPDDWLQCFGELVRSPELRVRLGREARRTVEEHYSNPGCAATLARVIRQLVARRPEDAGALAASR